MKLTHEDVTHLADLARLALNDDEATRAQQELESVLGYVARLSKIDTAGVEPSAMPDVAAADFRPDEGVDCSSDERALIIANFPAKRGDLLETPGVFEKPKK